MLNIEYEFAFFSLSSSNRDEDLNSDLDKFESFLQKDDSALYLQNKVAYHASMDRIEMIYGPFSDEKVRFYYDALSDGWNVPMNAFQREMIFNLFCKFFGDPSTIRMIDAIDYTKLVIAARQILEDAGMVLLPHIVSSKVVHLATRKNINKKELIKLESGMVYQQMLSKYRSESIRKQAIGLIATIMTSDFQAIEPEDPSINGKRISIIPDLILEEVPMFIDMV